MPKQKNTIVKYFNGAIPIRQSNVVHVRFSAEEYEKLLVQADNTSLSLAKIIALKSSPCQECGCDNVTLIVKKEKPSYRVISTKPNILEQQNGKRHDDSF